MVPYGRWSFTSGSEYSNLSWKFLVFWIGGHLWEVVAYKRWSFTSGSEYSNLSWKFLVFWIGGHLWKWSLTKGGRLRVVPSIVIWVGKVCSFGQAVAYGKWSLTGGGRTWRFGCITCSRIY